MTVKGESMENTTREATVSRHLARSRREQMYPPTLGECDSSAGKPRPEYFFYKEWIAVCQRPERL